MSETTTSADGTRIAYDRHGDGTGPAVIFVGGAMQFRGFDPQTVAMAGLLASHGFTVINYDRRGRGETEGATSFTLADELDDIAALIQAAGGEAALFGSSSGGAISLAAAAAGLPITKLALWEVPLPEENGTSGAEDLDGLRERIAGDDDDAVIEYFMKDMPSEWLDGARHSPGWPVMVSMGPSLAIDSEALAASQAGPRAELWGGITQPTIAIVGSETVPIMPPAADAIVEALPNATRVTVQGANHSWEQAAMVQALARFLAD
ncbi:alpha/beta fold hydrolase [Plantibacter sp. YIM 135249]|uniref:alpha/beta fold hydrolase n=1 Tax=Plantibacter sp. YIM 135249 TaxID=3423918 RepID=UPI003D331D82